MRAIHSLLEAAMQAKVFEIRWQRIARVAASNNPRQYLLTEHKTWLI